MTDETRNPTRGADAPDEERIGELLRRHRALYHDPPATPREAIWSRIEAERRGTGADGRGARVIPLGPRRWWLGTLAVAAVLALGIALGRISMRQEAERQGPAGAPVASADRSGRPLEEPREPDTGARPAESVLAEATPVEEPESEAAPAAEVRGQETTPERRAPVAVAAAPQATPAERQPAEASVRETPASPRDLYRLASQQMLGQAEALLVQYRTDRAAERMDPAIARWARDVLSSTRLLLDSPAADDPGMRDLLLDLELVLAQIVQRTGGGDVVDDELIDRTIEDRDLLPRLRGAIPAGVGAI